MGRNLSTKQLKIHENTVVLNGEVVFEGRDAFVSSRGGGVFCIIGFA